ncbi:MAG: Ku protein [Thermoplasmatota archaeon]
MRSIWKGSISFGLVNIPVKVVGAVSPKDIKFNLLHAKDGGRIKFRRTCSSDGKEVPQEEIVKGFEVGSGQYVTFTDEELKDIDPAASRTIDIRDFVPLAEIDPAYFDKPYYLLPDKNAEKAYSLFLEALEKSGRVGIAQLVMHDKEHLVALRARDGVVVMETMHHFDEMVPASSVSAEVPKHEVDKRQLRMAEQLIESLSAPFDPEKYKDEHRERVLEAVERKEKGHKVVVEPAAKPSVKAVDLMAALEKSLAEAKTRRPAKRPAKKASRKKGERHEAEKAAG